MASAVEEVGPGSVRMKLMWAFGRCVRSLRRSKPRGMVKMRACNGGDVSGKYSVRSNEEHTREKQACEVKGWRGQGLVVAMLCPSDLARGLDA